MDIALIGNPNTGKTSLFNHLTGSYEYVGNWSGVTVEKKVGIVKQKSAQLIDLPGVYSLNPLSRDEGVVTRFLLQDHFDALLNILDASQLRRNLHLTIQLLEFGAPMVIGLNMMDVAQMRGIEIDLPELSKLLGSPVVPVVARTGKGCEALAELMTGQHVKLSHNLLVDYGRVVEQSICEFESLLGDMNAGMPARWLALQLFEGNQDVRAVLAPLLGERELDGFIEAAASRLKDGGGGDSLEQHIYRIRNEYIEGIVEAVTIGPGGTARMPLSERIDRIVTNKVLGIPIFLTMMYLMFMLTFDWLGFPLSDALDAVIAGPVTSALSAGLSAFGVSEFIRSLVLDGIVAGVGGVLVFVPQIFILFFFISLLEDSGYMARVALVMDRLMELVGLNGKAFIPMMIGFGCNVPGVMAARTIETAKERLLTILLTPLMSCSARLPVYALFVGMFFLEHKALVVLSLYVLGVAIALILAKLLSKTILRGQTSLFVIELPPYRLPRMKALWRSTWDKGKGFIKKAGTFIFAGSVLIWLLSYTGPGGIGASMDDSYLAVIGGFFAPLFAPVGFGTWQAGASLLTGFLAKEAIISTMNIIYYVPDEATLQGLLSQYYTPLAAYSFMAFILLYIPCLATVATIYKETQSKKWTAFSMGYALAIAYLLAFAIYQGGKLIGLG
ncbi:ferrous iron transport protein B [Bacillus sp. FJAT-27251]|uniref:ferrous iron transport protein B n=1 Tax=Bacillus sp. FJAT-27251 TaxID=1684142 RepID=UPI0006A7C019|nr:ferrous iron transport protein B [Bacillus sp. FJAT-27251]